MLKRVFLVSHPARAPVAARTSGSSPPRASPVPACCRPAELARQTGATCWRSWAAAPGLPGLDLRASRAVVGRSCLALAGDSPGGAGC